MGVFIRAVITGFGVSLGQTLFKKVAKRLGLDESDDKKGKKGDSEVESNTITPAEPITES